MQDRDLPSSEVTRNFDLHCHSTYSDGLLDPAIVVQRAAANGVDVLALTDHDTVAGLAEAAEAAKDVGIWLVAGVEVSVTWNGMTVHIVGLGVNPQHPTLLRGLEDIRSSRGRRAERIAAELHRAGIEGALDGAYAYAENPMLIGRTHFARFLVSTGYAADVRSVFQTYLTPGKPGYVPHEWASITDAVTWIRASGGRAVVAHPGRYKISRPEMGQLLNEFKKAGGEAIEVITSAHSPEQYSEYAQYARDFGLLASRGSDFHGPGESKIDLGRVPQLPKNLVPVWHDWA